MWFNVDWLIYVYMCLCYLLNPQDRKQQVKQNEIINEPQSIIDLLQKWFATHSEQTFQLKDLFNRHHNIVGIFSLNRHGLYWVQFKMHLSSLQVQNSTLEALTQATFILILGIAIVSSNLVIIATFLNFKGNLNIDFCNNYIVN